MSDSDRLKLLEAEGFYSTQECLPSEKTRVDYDLLFMGQRIVGHRQLSSLSLDIDNALNPIDAALLLGWGPGIVSAYWRPHDPARTLQKAVTVKGPPGNRRRHH